MALVDPRSGTHATATSDSLGRFRIAPSRPGRYIVEVTRLGYEPARSPLFEMALAGSVPMDFVVRPEPLGIEGVEVSVRREAEELLGSFGLSPEILGRRWIDRETIDAMNLPGLPKDVIRWRHIAGVSVREFDPGWPNARLCVLFARAARSAASETCALTVLNGVPISSAEAFHLDPHSIEAIAILDPLDGTTFYGSAGSGGVVLMWTRRGR